MNRPVYQKSEKDALFTMLCSKFGSDWIKSVVQEAGGGGRDNINIQNRRIIKYGENEHCGIRWTRHDQQHQRKVLHFYEVVLSR